MNAVYLKAIDRSVNKSRFYNLMIQPDLWGGISLVREYGRIGQPGTLRFDCFNNETKAYQKQKFLVESKIKRGYQ